MNGYFETHKIDTADPHTINSSRKRSDIGRRARLSTIGVVISLLSLTITPRCAQAQQTIFNVPTTDVLDRGKAYAELDAPFKPNDSRAVGKFSSFVPRIVVGVGTRTEVGFNLTGNVQPGADQTTLVPTVKHKLYDGKGFALVAGDNVFVPIRNRAYRIGNYVYLNGSKTISRTRLTAGAYHFSAGVVSPDAQRAGGQFGFEQIINPRLTFAVDWITGKHSSGYFTPGAIFKPHTKVTCYAAYSTGNTGARRGNHFVLLEVGYNLN